MDEGDEIPPVGDAAEPAFVLQAGVPYIRGWADADQAVRQLQEALTACGLAGRVPFLGPQVTVAGVGVVELGRVTPATARLLAELLAAAASPPGGQASRYPAEGGPIPRPRAA